MKDFDLCAGCGHLRYHHRPECGFTDVHTQEWGAERCDCPRFQEPSGGAS